jgi:hypothetical protein
MKKSILNLGLTLLMVTVLACGKKEDKKQEETKTDTTKTETKVEEKKTEPTPDRMELLAIPDAELKCEVSETKITQLVIDGKEIKTDGLNQLFAQNWGTNQTVCITNFELDKVQYFAFNCDIKKMQPTQIRFDFSFNRYKRENNENKTIAVELGEYQTMREGFGTSATVYTPQKAVQLPGKAFLKAISTTKICGTFEYQTPDGKNIIKGEFAGANVVKK